ncbi:MAG: RHS repeat-associated core domain-containing protein, partial [Bacteroidota bacterium]
IFTRKLNERMYELRDHLGDARMIISDRKLSTVSSGVPGQFRWQVLSSNNLYPFGMEQPKRSNDGSGYRYGYNGMERDTQVTAGHYDTYFRQYDARLGRWWGIDPVEHPGESPYVAMGDNPVVLNDPSGAEPSGGPGDGTPVDKQSDPLNPSGGSGSSGPFSLGSIPPIGGDGPWLDWEGTLTSDDINRIDGIWNTLMSIPGVTRIPNHYSPGRLQQRWALEGSMGSSEFTPPPLSMITAGDSPANLTAWKMLSKALTPCLIGKDGMWYPLFDATVVFVSSKYYDWGMHVVPQHIDGTYAWPSEVRDAHVQMLGIVDGAATSAIGSEIAADGAEAMAAEQARASANVVTSAEPKLLTAGSPPSEAPVNVLASETKNTCPFGSVQDLPPEEAAAVEETVEHINNGTKPSGKLGKKWSTIFKNNGGDLPGEQGVDAGFKEYRVAPGSGSGNVRRIVTGPDGAMYYTWTHYGDTGNPPFIRIK